MWFFKLLLLLAIMASWFPIQSGHSSVVTDDPQIEEEEGEENEELAA